MGRLEERVILVTGGAHGLGRAYCEGLYPWDAVQMMDCVEQHEAEELATTRDGWPQVAGVGLGWRGGVAAGECQLTAARIRIGEEGSVDRDVRWHSSLVQARGDTRAVGLGGDGLADRRPVLRARGILDVRDACRALAHPGHAASA
jgi:NAD(P)-dependent dehydrogenase (short-subunit alcohol dehydrogenase family)